MLTHASTRLLRRPALAVWVVLGTCAMLLAVLLPGHVPPRHGEPPWAVGADGAPTAAATHAAGQRVDRAGAVALAARLTRALHQRDRSAWLDAFAAAPPAANPPTDVSTPPSAVAMRPATTPTDAAVLFDNLTQVPFDEAEYRVTDDPQPPSEPASATPFAPSLPTQTVLVSFVHRVSGVDHAAIAERYRWTLQRPAPGAPPRVVAVDGGPTQERNDTWPAPWDLSALVTVRTPHVLTLVARQHADQAAAWAGRAEQAATEVLDAWRGAGEPSPPVAGFLVFVAADRNDFARSRGGDRVAPSSVGVCVSLPAERDDGTVATPPSRGGPGTAHGGATGPLSTTVTVPPTRPYLGGSRITVDSTSADFTTGGARAQIPLFRHEMAHAQTAPYQTEAGGPAPLWVAEGFAGYLEWQDRPLYRWYVPAARTLVRGGHFTGALPTDAQIYSANADTSSAAYYLAMLAVRYLAETYGPSRAYQFVLSAYRDPRPEAVDTALRAATGLDRRTYERQWSAYVREHA